MTHLKSGAFLTVAAGVFASVLAYHSATHRAAAPAARESERISRADPSDRAIQARIAAKEGVVKDLIAGRTSLVQAAAVFRALGGMGPADMIRVAYPLAASEDEAYCRSVIDYVPGQAPAGQGDALVRDLKAEMNDRLRDGTLHLADDRTDADSTGLPR
jgi:hypothetical protein